MLGNRRSEDSNVPVMVNLGIVFGMTKIVDLVVGTHHVIAEDSKGRFISWGKNEFGEV